MNEVEQARLLDEFERLQVQWNQLEARAAKHSADYPWLLRLWLLSWAVLVMASAFPHVQWLTWLAFVCVFACSGLNAQWMILDMRLQRERKAKLDAMFALSERQEER